MPDDFNDLPGMEPDEPDPTAEAEAPTSSPEPASHEPPAPTKHRNPDWEGKSDIDPDDHWIPQEELLDLSESNRSTWTKYQTHLAVGAAFFGSLLLIVVGVVFLDGPDAETTEEKLEFEEALINEDLDAAIESPLFEDAPIGFQLDIIGRLLSGETSEYVAETEKPPGTDIKWTSATTGSYVFTMVVEGDGETLSKAENTSYEVRFVVNNEWPANEFYDDTGFEVFVRWNRLAGEHAVMVSDAQRDPIAEFEAEVQWLDPSTFEVHLIIPDHDVDVVDMRTEVYVYVTDTDGVFLYDSRDVADWTAERAVAADG